MNYRHAFHAGNFADLVKHATITNLLEILMAEDVPLRVVDTHAGAGAYDLGGPLAGRTREAEAGIARLMAEAASPAEFTPLKAAVSKLNPDGAARFYPGSPLLIAQALRAEDRYVGCELRPDDHAALAETLRPYPGTQALLANGYEEAARLGTFQGRTLVVIDPPFERPDDYDNILDAVAVARIADRGGVLAAWLPLKDLETFDFFLRRLEDLEAGPLLVGETRMKPLVEPLRMNGCAMVVVGAPPALEARLSTICAWVAERLGSAGAQGRATVITG